MVLEGVYPCVPALYLASSVTWDRHGRRGTSRYKTKVSQGIIGAEAFLAARDGTTTGVASLGLEIKQTTSNLQLATAYEAKCRFRVPLAEGSIELIFRTHSSAGRIQLADRRRDHGFNVLLHRI